MDLGWFLMVFVYVSNLITIFFQFGLAKINLNFLELLVFFWFLLLDKKVADVFPRSVGSSWVE